jgi:hypothetical protein
MHWYKEDTLGFDWDDEMVKKILILNKGDLDKYRFSGAEDFKLMALFATDYNPATIESAQTTLRSPAVYCCRTLWRHRTIKGLILHMYAFHLKLFIEIGTGVQRESVVSLPAIRRWLMNLRTSTRSYPELADHEIESVMVWAKSILPVAEIAESPPSALVSNPSS